MYILEFMSRILVFRLISLTLMASAKEITITFDNAPRFAKGYFNGPTRAQKLIENLQKAKVPNTVFFCLLKFI